MSLRVSLNSRHLSKISLTLLSQPGVLMTSPATPDSQSNRSWLIPSGRMAMDSQPRSVASYAPPLQKFPVEGQTAFCRVGSNCPVISLGTRQPNVAPTLWAPVGNHLPTRAMILALTPDSSDGISIQFTSPNPPPKPTGSFFQVILKRLRELKSQSPISFNASFIVLGIRPGSACCRNVGIRIFFSLARATAFSNCFSLMVRSIISIPLYSARSRSPQNPLRHRDQL